MKRFSVPLRSLTGQDSVECLVFAARIEDAGEAAIEKMKDKWQRHQDRDTDWCVDGPIREEYRASDAASAFLAVARSS